MLQHIVPGGEDPGTRTIHFGPGSENPPFMGNSIKTAKYNIVTFLPIFLFEMFSRAAYLYFLLQVRPSQVIASGWAARFVCKLHEMSFQHGQTAHLSFHLTPVATMDNQVHDLALHLGACWPAASGLCTSIHARPAAVQACLSWWSIVSPFGGFGSTAAIVFVLLVAAGKALWEDAKRHQEDRRTNASVAHVLQADGRIQTPCKGRERCRGLHLSILAGPFRVQAVDHTWGLLSTYRRLVTAPSTDSSAAEAV